MLSTRLLPIYPPGLLDVEHVRDAGSGISIPHVIHSIKAIGLCLASSGWFQWLGCRQHLNRKHSETMSFTIVFSMHNKGGSCWFFQHSLESTVPFFSLRMPNWYNPLLGFVRRQSTPQIHQTPMVDHHFPRLFTSFSRWKRPFFMN